MSDWQPIDSAPRDGTEVLLWYEDYLGTKDFVVSGHWLIDVPSYEETWEHSCGFGDADMWMPLPEAP